MKKTLLGFVTIVAFSAQVLAQTSLKIYNHTTKQEVTNTTVVVNQDTSTLYAGNFYTMNVSSTNISSKARKEEITMAPGNSSVSQPVAATSSICYAGTCFGPGTYVSPCKPTNVGDTILLACDFNYGNSFSTSLIRYTVYNCGNTNDSASFYIQFKVAPTGILNHTLNFSVSDAFPNPASSTLSFNYKISNTTAAPHVTIHNLLGTLVKTAFLTEANGTARLDVSDLEEGLYFYTLEVNNRPLTVRKFVVKR
ncbi:MAG: T9SS type A sorting domain-containing protein [Bacteroidia bacterium]